MHRRWMAPLATTRAGNRLCVNGASRGCITFLTQVVDLDFAGDCWFALRFPIEGLDRLRAAVVVGELPVETSVDTGGTSPLTVAE